MAKLKSIIPAMSEKDDSYITNSLCCLLMPLTEGIAIAELIILNGIEFMKHK